MLRQDASAFAVVGSALWEGDSTRPGHTHWKSIDSVALGVASAAVPKIALSAARPAQSGKPNDWLQGQPEQFSQRRACFDHERRYAVCAGVRRGISRCLRAGVAAAVRRPRTPIVVRGRDIARRGDDRLANEVLRAGVRSRKMNLQVPLAATAVPVE